MNHHEANDLIKRAVEQITYRSGWTFRFDRGLVTVEAIVNDPDSGGHLILYAVVSVDRYSYADPEEIVECVLRSVWTEIEKLESHERLEFLRCNGKHVWRPHTGALLHHRPHGRAQVDV